MNGCCCGGTTANVDGTICQRTMSCNRDKANEYQESSRIYQPETWNSNNPTNWPCYHRPREQAETHSWEPTGGCGRPNCPRIVYPPPEVEWQYTNYNRNGHRWPLERDDLDDDNLAWEEADYHTVCGTGREELEDKEIFRKDEDNDLPYESSRVGGGCDEGFETNDWNFLNKYGEPIDRRSNCTEPKVEKYSQWCEECSKGRCDSLDDDNRKRKWVHFFSDKTNPNK